MKSMNAQVFSRKNTDEDHFTCNQNSQKPILFNWGASKNLKSNLDLPKISAESLASRLSE